MKFITLGTRKVLDHGFVTLHNVAGPTCSDMRFDRQIALAARTSFNNPDTNEEQDLKLVRYLMKHRHTSPFEMIEIWCEMQLPIFLARQFVRHRTTSINEISGRYVQLPECWYIPEPEQVGVRPASVKQGRDVNLPNMHTGWFINQLNQACLFDYASYKSALNREIPPELARLFLHLNHYTRWLWKQDLHNMLHFFSLRLESHAQWEARQYGKALFQLLSNYLPKTLEFWAEENAHLALELS